MKNLTCFTLATLAAASLTLPMAQAQPDTTADVVYGKNGIFTSAKFATANSLNNPTATAIDSNSNLYVVDSLNNRVLFYLAGSTTATRVYGQLGSLVDTTVNKGGVSADSLRFPKSVALDGSGNLYISDAGNHRVLVFPPGSTTATKVYGQGGNFTTATANNGGISATSLSSPNGLAIDSAGTLYVADPGNARVLGFVSGSTTATQIWGAATFTAAGGGNTSTTFSATVSPAGLAVDSSGNLYAADTFNNRVLVFPSGSTTANKVYGQSGSFTSKTSAGGADGLTFPQGIKVDSSGTVYIADTGNNRVLVYASGSTTASGVYGQPNLSGNSCSGSPSATTLCSPADVTLVSGGGLLIADSSNSRILGYPAGSQTATTVYGQAGSFSTISLVTADSLGTPAGMALDAGGNLYVADRNNPRVLYFPAGSTTATRVYGQGGSFTTITSNFNGVTADSLGSPADVAVDSGGNLYVADGGNHRVLYYPAGSTTATRVYGQGGSFTTATNNKGGRSATSLFNPLGLALDSGGNLYVSDASNNRVLYFPAGQTTATRVYGQGGSFTTGTQSTTANGLFIPRGLAVDSNGVYISDANNNRVLFYPGTSTTATRVWGQSNFTSRVTGLTASNLNAPVDTAVDSAGNLFVADQNANRVLYFPSGATTATQVYGQNGSFTTSNLSPITANSLDTPVGVLVDGNGNLYIADNANGRVLKFNAPAAVPVTVNTSPAGLAFSVNGISYTTAQTFNLIPGSSHLIATTSPQAGSTGTQYAFANWSNGGAISHTPAISTAATLTATFNTQYLLTTAVNGPGSVSPATGYQNAGLVNVTSTPSSGCAVFTGWTGATVTAGQVNLTGPATLTANFSAATAGPAVKGSLQTVRGIPNRYRQAVSVQNTTTSTADVSIILDTFGTGVSVLAPVSATGTTTACTGVAGRAFYTVTGVAPGAFGTVTFDFAAPSGAGVIYNASGIVGAGPR